MIKPNFNMLWHKFPDHIQYQSMKDLYTALGGAAKKNINLPGFGANGNTCASRMSIAFNNAGAPINMAFANVIGTQTLGTANGSHIILSSGGFSKLSIQVAWQTYC